MTVQELIDKLMEIEHKHLPVLCRVNDSDGVELCEPVIGVFGFEDEWIEISARPLVFEEDV